MADCAYLLELQLSASSGVCIRVQARNEQAANGGRVHGRRRGIERRVEGGEGRRRDADGSCWTGPLGRAVVWCFFILPREDGGTTTATGRETRLSTVWTTVSQGINFLGRKERVIRSAAGCRPATAAGHLLRAAS